MPNRAFLLIHGFGGSDAGHWQRWLHARLEAAGEVVHFPQLPDPDHPRLEAWLAALAQHLEALQGRERIVLTHSCGSLLWLHHAELFAGANPVDRVLLNALPSPEWSDPDVIGFSPVPISGDALKRASKSTRMVSGTDDPYCPLAATQLYQRELAIPCDVIPNGRHLNIDAGYGPWPAMEQWALENKVPLASNSLV